MKGKRLLIVGAALALAISGCASATRLTRQNPLKAGSDSTKYSLINSVDDLESGKSYIITSGVSGTVSAISIVSNNNNRKTIEVSVSDGKITRGSSVMSFTLGGSSGKWTFATENYAGTAGYLASAASGNNNYLRVIPDVTTATVDFDGDAAVINVGPHASRTQIRYNPNNGTPLFACYSSGQQDVYLWKENSDGPAAQTHTLSYAVGNHGVYDGSSVKAFTVVEQSTHTVLSPATVGISGETGYIFAKWNDGSNDYNPNSSYTMGSSDATLTAQWLAGVALTYDANNGSNAPATSYVVSGETQTVASAAGMTAPDGKQFAHWNTESDDSGDSFNPGAEIENFTSPLTLYAIWEDLTHINFDAKSDKGTGSITKNDITMTSSNGVLNNGSEYRFYKNSTLTFARSSGKISSIEFTGVKDYAISNLSVTNGGGTLTTNGNSGVWEGAASSVTFTASAAQARATYIVVNYLLGSDVSLDKNSLVLTLGGTGSTVSVSSISGVTNPSYLWSRASGDDCISLSGETTDSVTVSPKGSLISHCVLTLSVSGSNLENPIVREVSVIVGKASSAENPYTISEAMRAIDVNHSPYLNDAHVQGVVSKVDGFNETYKSITYWISVDGTLEENQLQVYSGKDIGGADFSAAENVQVGAEVVVKGTLKKYNSTYEFDKNNELVTYSVPVLTPEQEVAKLKTHASLSYNYNIQGNGAIDTIDKAFTGITGTSGYPDWSDVSGDSGVVYAGNNYAGANSIQFNASNSSGLVVTANETGNVAKKITVEWTSSTTEGRTIGIYASDTPYSSAADLHDAEKQGTLIGTIVKGTSTTLEISDEYTYIGIKSQANALNMDSIKIQWGELPTLKFTNVAIRFGGSIDPELWNDLAGDGDESLIAGYGVAFAKAGSFEGSLKDSIADVENPNGFYKPISAKPNGHPDSVGGNYVWNLYLKISTIKNDAYFEGNLDDDITAVAYIKLTNGTVVFLKEETTSVKKLAQGLVSEYEEGFLDGSLDYLANL